MRSYRTPTIVKHQKLSQITAQQNGSGQNGAVPDVTK